MTAGTENTGYSNSAYVIDCADILDHNSNDKQPYNSNGVNNQQNGERNQQNGDVEKSNDDAEQPDDDVYDPNAGEDADIQESPISFRTKLFGTLFALGAAVFYVIEYTLLAYLKELLVTEVVFAFMVVMLVLLTPLLIWKRTFWAEFQANAFCMILFGCFAAFKTILLNIAMTELPIGDASSVIYSSPVFVIILARVFLKERVTWFRVFFVLLVLVGVICVVHPPAIFSALFHEGAVEEKFSLKGYLCALGASFLTASEATVLRKLKNVYFANKMFVYVIICMMVMYASFPFMCKRLALPSTTNEWVFLAVTGCVLFVAVVFLNIALQKQEASVVAVVRCSEVVLSFIVQVLVFKMHTIYITYIGAALILLSAACIALEKLVKRIIRKVCPFCRKKKTVVEADIDAKYN